MKYSVAFLQRLHDSIDMVKKVSSCVPLIRVNQFYTGVCPFCNPSYQSLVLHEHSKSIVCFNCNLVLDLFEFLIRIEKKSFNTIIDELYKEHAILPEEKSQEENIQDMKDYLAILSNVLANQANMMRGFIS